MASEVRSGASIPARSMFSESRGAGKETALLAPHPRLSAEPGPIPRVSPGLRGAGGCRVRLAEALRRRWRLYCDGKIRGAGAGSGGPRRLHFN